MSELVKIRDVANKYNVTARTLRYYEEIGLLSSTRDEDSAYRQYDELAVKRVEQILILRKLNISVKDIQRIFNDSGSNIVLEVLEKKVENIDEEVSLLHELREIVLDFIHEMEKISFKEHEDIKQLYNKAKEIEIQITNSDYMGKPSNVQRLFEVVEKLDKKVPDIMVIRVPAFRGLTSGVHTWGNLFKEGGSMFQLWQHFDLFQPILFDSVDFTVVKSDDEGEMICSIGMDVQAEQVAPLEIVDFPGGLYAMAVTIDEDDESIIKVQNKISKWLEQTNFVLDTSRSVMFNMPYLDEENMHQKDIEKGLGYRQQQRYVPIKLKEME